MSLLLLFNNSPPTVAFPLFLSGYDIRSGVFPLFISGIGSTSSGVPLFEHGIAASSGGIPLFVNTTEHKTMPLYLNGVYSTASGFLPLLTSGILHANFYKHVPLYVCVSPTGQRTTNMNLWVGGVPYNTNASVPLFCGNYYIGSTLPLFIQAPGSTDGGLPYDANMVLFLKRPFEAGIPMVVAGPGTPVSTGIPLVVPASDNSMQGNITLVVGQGIGSPNSRLPLYTHGF